MKVTDFSPFTNEVATTEDGSRGGGVGGGGGLSPLKCHLQSERVQSPRVL